jgi:hypothetical protein
MVRPEKKKEKFQFDVRRKLPRKKTNAWVSAVPNFLAAKMEFLRFI